MSPTEILNAIPRLSALVVGDICLDRWCTYDPAVSEPSRETGIPRIGVVRTETTAGAAGTVANNLAALGCARVAVLGAIGDDGNGFELSRALRERGIESDLCVHAINLQTFTYTKLINQESGAEDRSRIDFINSAPLDLAIEKQLLERLLASVAAFDAVVISDQAETQHGGVVTAAMRQLLSKLALRHPDKIFLADSRARIAQFRNVLSKPNQQEADAACHTLFDRVDYSALRRYVEARTLIVTHGEQGALVVNDAGETWVHARAVEHPVDICGAGDSFSAGTALALAAGASAVDAVSFGNLAASITIMKKGTGIVTRDEAAERCRLWQ
jgi:rfaE bifunctional protein kinase chain/domain